jgi:membrane protease YdiL (CAAX protease family)
VSTLVFQIIFSGFGEEFLYRGFIQGELNRVFQKRFVFGKLNFGWGLIITAVLFGIGHLLNPFNPFQGHFNIDISSFVFTTILGAFLGLIREYFGGLIVVSLIHGGGNVFPTLFDTSLYGNIGYWLSYGLLCAYLGSLIFDKKVEKEK